jgi:hypothetical protein
VEPRFDFDFSNVSIHAGAKAAESARAINAAAYTVGDHVVLGSAPSAASRHGGLYSLGHELAHVVQQRRGGPSSARAGSGGLEQAADAAASTLTTGGGPVRVSGASAPGLARQPASGGAEVAATDDGVAVWRTENEDGTWTALNARAEVLYSGPLGPVVDPGLPDMYSSEVLDPQEKSDEEKKALLKQYRDPAWEDPLSPIRDAESYDPEIYDIEVLKRRQAERKFDKYDQQEYGAHGKIYKRKNSGRVYANDIAAADFKELAERYNINVSTDPDRVVLPTGIYAFESVYEGKLLKKVMADNDLPREAIHRVAAAIEADIERGAQLMVAGMGTGQVRIASPRFGSVRPPVPPRSPRIRQLRTRPPVQQTPPSPAPTPVTQVVRPTPNAPSPSRIPRWLRSLVLSARMTMQGAARSPINIRTSSSAVGGKTPWKSSAKVAPNTPTTITTAPRTTTAPTQATAPPQTAATVNTAAPTTGGGTASAPMPTTGVNAPVATPMYTQGGFTIGVTPIGVHAESAAPLTSRRQMHTDVPEQGTQLGSQTQIGPEIVTAINGVPVTSRDPNILIGADTARFRADALAIILADANHPLAALVDYVNRTWVARPYQYGNMLLWQQNPVDWQAGHGISNRLGGADVIILQSTYRNQIQSARLERHGAVSKDEYYDIGGIAVDPLTAWDLYNRGLLPLPPTSYPKFKL